MGVSERVCMKAHVPIAVPLEEKPLAILLPIITPPLLFSQPQKERVGKGREKGGVRDVELESGPSLCVSEGALLYCNGTSGDTTTPYFTAVQLCAHTSPTQPLGE